MMIFRRALARLRLRELQLIVTALLFFACGYILVAATTGSRAVVLDRVGIADLLWPSIVPSLLFIGISLMLSWRMPNADQFVLPLVALLVGLGLLMMARLAPALGSDYADVDSRQSLWVMIGIIALGSVLFVPWDQLLRRYLRTSLMDWLAHYRYVWLVAGIVLILLTFALGVDPNGSGVKAWFNFGFFHFQPSELLKIILVIFLASYLDEHRELVTRSYHLGPVRLPPLPYLVPLTGMWGLAMGLIIFQRDLGAALLLFSVFLAMLYVATGRGSYVVAGLSAFAIGSFALYTVVAVVRTRVMIWLDPWIVAQSSGYQIVQSIYALASGGLFGSGLGRGVPAIIPAVHTDFIFSAIGEELGLAGTIGVLIAYLLLIGRGYHIALHIPGRFRGFEQLMAVGLTTILAMQTFIIIAGNVRLIPLTGITLPFISYGGSSILMNFVIIGLLLRISAGEQRS